MTRKNDDEGMREQIRERGRNDVERPDFDERRPPPTNVMHGSLRYVRSQRHLFGFDRVGARGGRDDVSFEQETWRGRDELMRQMHGGSGGTQGGGEQRGADHRGRGPRRAPNDQRLREDVCEALTVHDRVDATDIEVDVKDGVVTLSGTVPTREERRFAEDAAYVKNVVDVVNMLRVQPREPIGERPSPFARARVEP